MFWYYASWVPFTILYWMIHAYISKQSNDGSSKWLIILIIYGALCPFWVIVSRISKNILFDGMLYDNIVFLSYLLMMLILKSGSKFTDIHWLGLLFVVLGSILMRINCE